MTNYKDSKPYQSMSNSQRVVFDYWDEHDAMKSRLPKAMKEVTAWKSKQDAMTALEKEQREEEIRIENKTAGIVCTGLAMALGIFVIMLIVGELSGNPLVD